MPFLCRDLSFFLPKLSYHRNVSLPVFFYFAAESSRCGLERLFITQIKVEWAGRSVDRIPLGGEIITAMTCSMLYGPYSPTNVCYKRILALK